MIDNAEHKLASMGFLAELAAVAPPLVLLVTSRTRLQLRGEWVVEIQGLPYPSGAGTRGLHDYDAVSLFEQTAARACGAALSATERPWVEVICRHVEGLPLAIELASAWTRSLPCEAIAQNLAHDIASLSAPFQDLPNRHWSMGAVFEHSWCLLSPIKQGLLRRLAIFHGGFTTIAAADITAATPALLAALVDASLVRRREDQRYELHALIRQFAMLKLQDDHDEHQSVQDRHATYYITVLVQHDSDLREPRLHEVLATITTEIENVRAAWQRVVECANVTAIRQAARVLALLRCTWLVCRGRDDVSACG